jgi:hypothetical protein
MIVSTVYLKGPWGPGGAEYLSGFVADYPNSPTVEVSKRDDFRGSVVRFPRENIARIEIDTGWR